MRGIRTKGLTIIVAVLVLGALGATTVQASNYGVIFSGGVDRYNNHDRYYDETLRMWNIMTGNLGYDVDKVYVLFADGTNPAVDRSDGTTSSDWSMIPASGHISPATRTDLYNTLMALDDLIVPGEDCFHFWSFDHGGNPTYSSSTPATLDLGYLCAWRDATGAYQIQDDEFATWVSGINGYAESYAFAQCFAGDMVDDLGILPGDNRFAAYAADWYEPSYGQGWADAWADALEAGLRYTHEIGEYARMNDIFGPGGTTYKDWEHPGWIGDNFHIITNEPYVIPEPGTLALLGLGLGLVGFGARRRVKKT